VDDRDLNYVTFMEQVADDTSVGEDNDEDENIIESTTSCDSSGCPIPTTFNIKLVNSSDTSIRPCWNFKSGAEVSRLQSARTGRKKQRREDAFPPLRIIESNNISSHLGYKVSFRNYVAAS
jgi:hypothetical protein